jgi:hypothetical protein
MYCSSCGEVITPEDYMSDELCNECWLMINNGDTDTQEEIILENIED